MAKKEENETAELKALKKELFAKYEEADEEVEKAKAALETATAARSAVVQEITEKLNKTLFRRKGRILKVTKRTNKTTGATTYFFRGGSEEVEDADD